MHCIRMPQVLSQATEDASVSPKGSGLFTDEAATRMTAAFARTVAKVRAEDELRDRVEHMESVVASLNSRIVELEKNITAAQSNLTATSIVADSETSYSSKP